MVTILMQKMANNAEKGEHTPGKRKIASGNR
jgi:hypothetical protein